MSRVLVVDDDSSILWLLNRVLTANGYEVIEAADGLEAVAALDHAPDVVILDRMLAGMDGLEVLAEIRRRGDTPVLLLSALSGEADRVRGLDLGADDYLGKPFSVAELEARVRALLRRTRQSAAASDRADRADRARDHDADHQTLHIDRAARSVLRHGVPVALTRMEFDLLAFLVDHPDRVVGIPELLEQVWHSSADWQDPRTVKEHVRRLRNKLEPDPARPALIRTVRGAGYLFSAFSAFGGFRAEASEVTRQERDGQTAPV
ncbi:MAG: two-component system, OmpR family, response regulator CpxR [Acidimicrobiaceae bacterium]|jgi:DNA-binding response OmpR family regulator|nr:two-component system, OmpR family, response regulator CpxR [Acidimicrobiaceae bacterium]